MAYSTEADLRIIMPAYLISESTNDNNIVGFVNDPPGYAINSTIILHQGFEQLPVAGDTMRFGNHVTIYTISNPTATQLEISPPLTVAVADNETIMLLKVVNSTVLTETIKKADEVIDSYFRTRFSTPFSPVPQTIKDFSARLTRGLLLMRRGYESDYDAVIRQLEKFQARARAIDLGVEANETSKPVSTNYNEENNLFVKSSDGSSDPLSGYRLS